MASNGIDYSIVMRAEPTRKMLSTGAVGFQSVLNRLLLDGAGYIRQEMSKRAPEGVGASQGAGLQKSIAVQLNKESHEVRIWPTAPYAAAVEFGSRPHRPPTYPNSPLDQWCKLKGLNLWAVSNSIARRGTRPHPFIQPTYHAAQAPVQAMINNGISHYIEGLMNGR